MRVTDGTINISASSKWLTTIAPEPHHHCCRSVCNDTPCPGPQSGGNPTAIAFLAGVTMHFQNLNAYGPPNLGTRGWPISQIDIPALSYSFDTRNFGGSPNRSSRQQDVRPPKGLYAPRLGISRRTAGNDSQRYQGDYDMSRDTRQVIQTNMQGPPPWSTPQYQYGQTQPPRRTVAPTRPKKQSSWQPDIYEQYEGYGKRMQRGPGPRSGVMIPKQQSPESRFTQQPYKKRRGQSRR